MISEIIVAAALAGMSVGAVVDAPATRGTAVQVTPTDPPPTPSFTSESADGRCVGAEGLLAHYSPGWSVARMSRIMYRESRCQPRVRSGANAVGLLQVMVSNCPYLRAQMGESCDGTKLTDPTYNVRAARELFQYDGYGPWKV